MRPSLVSVAALAWCTITLFSSLGPPLPPLPLLVLGVVSAGLAALGPRLPASTRAPLLAVVALPLWLSAVGLVGPLPASPGLRFGVGAPVLVLGLAGLRLAEGRPLRLGLIGLALVLGLRALLAPGVEAGGVDLAATLALCLILTSISLGLPAAASRPAALALSLACAVRLATMSDLVTPPSDEAGLRRAQAAGLLAVHAKALAAEPALGLVGVELDPTNHTLALALLADHPVEVMLDRGWRPAGAPLSTEQTLQAAHGLERRGRGGEAMRLLWSGRRDGQLAWTLALFQRDLGHEPTVASASPPPATPRLPGTLPMTWAALRDEARAIDLHLDEATTELLVEGRSQACDGPAELEVRVGAVVRRVVLPETTGAVRLPWPLAAGPQRLHLAFLNDHVTTVCDRNLWVDRLTLR